MANLDNLKPFQKGEDSRRNTKGRAKGSKNGDGFKNLLLKHIMKEVDVGGIKRTKLDIIAEGIIDDIALKKDRRLLELFLNYTQGRPKSAVQMAIQNGERVYGGQTQGQGMTDEEYERLKEVFPNHHESKPKSIDQP